MSEEQQDLIASLRSEIASLRQRMTEMAVERIDATVSAYHDGAKDMQDKCLQALERCHDAGAAGIVRSIPLPERTISLL